MESIYHLHLFQIEILHCFLDPSFFCVPFQEHPSDPYTPGSHNAGYDMACDNSRSVDFQYQDNNCHTFHSTTSAHLLYRLVSLDPPASDLVV